MSAPTDAINSTRQQISWGERVRAHPVVQEGLLFSGTVLKYAGRGFLAGRLFSISPGLSIAAPAIKATCFAVFSSSRVTNVVGQACGWTSRKLKISPEYPAGVALILAAFTSTYITAQACSALGLSEYTGIPGLAEAFIVGTIAPEVARTVILIAAASSLGSEAFPVEEAESQKVEVEVEVKAKE